VGKAVPQAWFDAKSAPSEVADYLTPSESNLARAAVRGMAVPGTQIRIGFVDATVMQDSNDPFKPDPIRVRGFTVQGSDGIIVSLEPLDARAILGVTAHEAGHALGLDHPPSSSWRRWLMRGDPPDFMIWNQDTLDSKRFQLGDFDIIRNRQSFFVPYVPN
jgi:hypothetical protein